MTYEESNVIRRLICQLELTQKVISPSRSSLRPLSFGFGQSVEGKIQTENTGPPDHWSIS